MSSLFWSLPVFLWASLITTTSVAAAFAQDALPNHLSKRVVADYGYWSKYQTPAYGAAQIPFHKVTHINHAGVGFDSTGTLSVPQGFIEPELNNKAHAAGVKVMLLLGGDFVGLESSGNLRSTTSPPSKSSTVMTASTSIGNTRRQPQTASSWWR